MFLGFLYKFCSTISLLCIVLICLLIVGQITGRIFNFIIPSSDDIIGYLVANACFFGAVYTMNRQAHIRVDLLVSKLNNRNKFKVECFNLILAIFIVCTVTYFFILMTLEGIEFEDVNSGYLSFPMYYVHIPSAFALIVLCIVTVDRLIQLILQTKKLKN